MNINTTISYANPPFRVQRIAASTSTNNEMLFTQQQKDQLEYEYFINELAQHDRMLSDQKKLSKLQEEKLKELDRILKKHDNLLNNGHFVDIWY